MPCGLIRSFGDLSTSRMSICLWQQPISGRLFRGCLDGPPILSLIFSTLPSHISAGNQTVRSCFFEIPTHPTLRGGKGVGWASDGGFWGPEPSVHWRADAVRGCSTLMSRNIRMVQGFTAVRRPGVISQLCGFFTCYHVCVFILLFCALHQVLPSDHQLVSHIIKLVKQNYSSTIFCVFFLYWFGRH